MTEYIDIYDAQGRLTGQKVARGTRLEPGQYQWYVTALIQDVQGRFLITRRALDKSWAAGWWECTGGGVPAGETVQQAVVREIAEEVGLQAEPDQLELIHQYRNDDENGDNYFMSIYLAHLDFTEEDVVLQAEEAIDCRLAMWEDIAALDGRGVFLHFRRIAAAMDAWAGAGI